MSACPDIDELVELILHRTVETLGATLGHIILLTPQGPIQKSCRFSKGIFETFQAQLPPLTSLLTRVHRSRQGILIANAHEDGRWPMTPDDSTHAVVLVPLFGRRDLLGLLVLAHKKNAYFRLEHRLLLQAIASQAAIAIENARLYGDVAKDQQRLAAVLQNAADAILLFDSKGTLILLNPAGGNLFVDGYAKLGERPGRGCGYDRLIDLLDAALAAGKGQIGEIIWPDERVFTAHLVPIEAGGCVAVLNDISRFKKLEQVQNDFISEAVHGLKNTLTKITLMSDLIPKLGPLTNKQAEFITNISANASTMDKLVRDLLELTRIDSGNFELKDEKVNVNKLAARIAEEFKEQAGCKGQSLEVNDAVGEPEVHGDIGKLQLALRELVSNAVKFTPERGSILISVQSTRDSVTIFVQDNGFGIPQAELPFVFDRFYRVNNDRVKGLEGHGLGLAITKSIAEIHGGQVHVVSEYGKGSCFAIHLPKIRTRGMTATAGT